MKGGTSGTSQCIYCLRSEGVPFDKAHIFPRSIGGHLWLERVCKPCNGVIGHIIESQVKKSLFFATAIAKLGLQSNEETSQHLTIREPETAESMLAKMQEVGVWAMPFGPMRIRMVTHLDVSRSECKEALVRIGKVFT